MARLESAPARAPAVAGRQQQPLPCAAGTPAFSQPGLARPRAVSAPLEPGLGGALAASGAGGGKFRGESQYRGTCYRACGFAAVGATKGFARASRDFYLEHGQPKQLYLRELCPDARRLLRQARWPAALAACEAELAGPCPFRAPGLERLLERFGALPDPREAYRVWHRQRFVLACAAVSTLLGACGYQAFENTCKNYATVGLTYTVRFSGDLITWPAIRIMQDWVGQRLVGVG